MTSVRKNELFRVKGRMTDSYFPKLTYTQQTHPKAFDYDLVNGNMQNIILFDFEYVANNEFHEQDRNEILSYEYAFSFYALFNEQGILDFKTNVHPITSNPDVITNHPIDSFTSLFSIIAEEELISCCESLNRHLDFKSLEITCILKPKTKHQLPTSYGDFVI